MYSIFKIIDDSKYERYEGITLIMHKFSSLCICLVDVL